MNIFFFFIFWSTEQGTHDVIQECKWKCSEDQASSLGYEKWLISVTQRLNTELVGSAILNTHRVYIDKVILVLMGS